MTIDYTIRENATGQVATGWWSPMGGGSARVVKFMATDPDWAYHFKYALFTGNWGGLHETHRKDRGEYTFLWARLQETGQVVCQDEVWT